jgi:hypothetical protein
VTVYRLYLSDNFTTSPFPTTSRELRVSAGASARQINPGEFDSGLPGTTDAGQWQPSSAAAAATTLAGELETVSANQSPTRQGFLWQEQSLTGLVMEAGNITASLRVSASQGTGTQGNFFMRVSVVSGATGTFETKNSLTPTNITGEASHASGQSFWSVSNEAAFGVSALSTIVKTFPVTSHTFAAGERLLFELGFGAGDSTADRTWVLEFNNSNVYIDTTDIAAAAINLTVVASAGQECTATPIVMTKNLRIVPVTP